MHRIMTWAALVAVAGLGGGSIFAGGPAGDEQIVRYDGYKVVRVMLETPRDLRTIEIVSADRWTHDAGLGESEYMLDDPGLAALDDAGIEYHVLIEDVEALVDAERTRLAAAKGQDPQGGIAGVAWFDDFKDYDAVNARLDFLADLNPDIASTFVVGQSLEGRDIRGIRITGPGDDKPAVLFDGCQHAREWVAVMVPMYIADTLVQSYGSDPVLTDLVNRVEFFIVPIVNPDGYVYSWGPERLWRKNRRNNGDGTFGVDLNRNWSYEWGGPGSDSNSNSETYRGTGPFSEPETTAMKAFMEVRPNIAVYNDFHAYGQLHLQPWGWTEDLPPDHGLLDYAGANMEIESQAVNGADYVHGPAAVILYLASGNAFDWAYGDQGIFGFTTELRPSSGSGGGFILPANQIIPTCTENFAAAMWLANWATIGAQFSYPLGLPDVVQADAPTEIALQITPVAAGPLDDATGRVFWRTGAAGSFNEASLNAEGGNDFLATLPGAACGEIVEYYFQIADESGDTYTDPAEAPEVVHFADSLNIAVAFGDDFETDQNWTVQNIDGLTDGGWDRGVPVGGGDRGDPAVDGDGSGQCYLTDNVDGNSDVDAGATVLTSPLMDASEPGAVLEYARWYSNTFGGSPEADVFVVEASDDSGATWVEVETVGPAGPEVSGGWFQKSFVIADIAGISPTDEFRVRFTASDYGQGSVVEAGVDGVQVASFGCDETGTPGDFDGDGDVDASDLATLLADWGDCGGCETDLDGDGAVGAADLAILLANWG